MSRGELIEIGDAFRLPDLLESTGAQIREVGTTNRTTAADYAAAIGPQTAFVLKVHPSNYRIEGFTASASVAELAGLSVPVVGDIGSGPAHPAPAAARRARRQQLARRRRCPGDSERRQAARRSAGWPAARPHGPGRTAGPASAGQGASCRQADGRGAGGDADRTAAAGSRAARRPVCGADRAGRPDRGRSRRRRHRRARGNRRRQLAAAARPESACRVQRSVCRPRWRPSFGQAHRCAGARCPPSSDGSRTDGCCLTCAR